MTRSIRRYGCLVVTALSVSGAYACSGPTLDSPTSSMTMGEVSVALTQVPEGVGCIVLEATPVGSTDALRKEVSVEAGVATSFTMSSLPPGPVTFEGLAYPGACPPRKKAEPTWLSRPTTITVAAGTRTPLLLIMERPGSVDVQVDFRDGTDAACPAGQFLCDRPDGTLGPCSDHLSDRDNCGACGNACNLQQDCIAGTCVTPNSCPAGQFLCDRPDGTLGPCSDHLSDRDNCGACGNTCNLQQDCIVGVCQ